jgi:alkylation response protein AidB-like acyl-CoA dehydrogenase
MDFAFSEEQEMLRGSARDFLAKECSPKVVRRLMESSDAYDSALWKKIVELGWTALGIPEQYGGVGTFLDLVVVLEEAGRALLPGPSSRPGPRHRRRRCLAPSRRARPAPLLPSPSRQVNGMPRR